MKLRIIKGYRKGDLIELPNQSLAIGREEDNDFIIPDAQISRYHCRLYQENEEWYVEDLNSINGVSVNGKKIYHAHVLHSGDEITVYKTIFKLENDNEAQTTSKSHFILKNFKPIAQEAQNSNLTAPKPPSPLDLLIPLSKVILFIAVLASIGVLIYLLMTPTEETETNAASTQTVSTIQPEPPQVTPVATSTQTAPTPIKEVLSETDKQLSDPSDITATDSRNEKKQTAPMPIVKIIPPPPCSYLVVKSEPAGATIELDEKPVGKTPAVLTDLPKETLSLCLKLPGYEPLRKLVNLADGSSLAPMKLTQKIGTLLITTDPAGALIQEGRMIHGTTPMLLRNLPMGDHQFTIERKGYEPQRSTVSLNPTRGEQLHVTLKPKLGTLEISSTPPQCKVFLDGQMMGITQKIPGQPNSKPLVLKNLLPGPCTVKILHPQTGIFDTFNTDIPKTETRKYRSFIWIPTHKVVLLNGKTVIGMMIHQTDNEIHLLNSNHKREQFIRQEYTALVPISPEDQALIIKNRAHGREPSGQQSTKSKLSITVDDFLKQARYPSFKGYVKQKLCITGKVTTRMKTHQGIMIEFSKLIHCRMAPTAPATDYKVIGKLQDADKMVSLRGIYEGTKKDGTHVFTNCILLPFPD